MPFPKTSKIQSFAGRLITQRLDTLALQWEQNTSSFMPQVGLESPSPSGGKFWIGTVEQDGISIRWGKLGANGSTKHIPTTQCRQHSPILELKECCLSKIAAGYDLVPATTLLP